MVISYSRGHKIYYDKMWKYCDNNLPLDNSRSCKKCGMTPTKDGYDYCLGHIDNATNACCGHGINEGYINYEEN